MKAHFLHFHCWHRIDGTTRKIKQKQHRDSCRERNPYLDCNGDVLCSVEVYCCICGRHGNETYTDMNADRALQYPAEESEVSRV